MGVQDPNILLFSETDKVLIHLDNVLTVTETAGFPTFNFDNPAADVTLTCISWDDMILAIKQRIGRFPNNKFVISLG